MARKRRDTIPVTVVTKKPAGEGGCGCGCAK